MTLEMLTYNLQNLFISLKNCIVVTDVVMTLLVLAESVMQHVVITLFMTGHYPLINSNAI